MKGKFDIELNNADNVHVGYVKTTKPMTVKQVEAEMVKMGKELIRNKKVTNVDYDAYCENNGYPIYTWATIRKSGRKFIVLTNSMVEHSKQSK